jgi:hypothetical protein
MAYRRLSSEKPSSVPLSAEQQAVLECVEQGLSGDDVSDRTGFDAALVSVITQDLVSLGVLAEEPARPHWEAAPPAEAADLPESELPPGVEPWSGDPMPHGTSIPAEPDAGAEERETWHSSIPPSRSSVPPRSRPPGVDELNYRRLYEMHFRALEPNQRADAARHVHGGDLYALCLDPAPEVIAAVMDNSHFGLDHARIIALRHKNPQGIEILTRRQEILRDHQVQRRLMQNVQLPESVLERIVRMKPLIEIYRLCVDRELPERNRLRVRSRLGRCFAGAEPEERAALVIKTEGRCLTSLAGATFDGRTSQILCNVSFSSSLFVQNLARFPATPPMLLAKLLRSPPARNQAPIRALLMRHPNMSADLKRRGSA